MRNFLVGLAAIGCGAALGACGESSAALKPVKTDPAAVERLAAELAEQTFKSKASAPSDMAAVRDALPEWVKLSWGGLAFDEAAGATVLTAVKVTPADMPEVGLFIDEARLWDFDANLAKARLAGMRLDETVRLASRLDMKGVSVFGLDALMAPAFDAYAGAVEEAISALEPGAPPLDIGMERYEMRIGRILIDDLMLRPFEFKPAQLAADNDFARALPGLQLYAAIARSFAADALAAFDARAAYSMRQMGEAMSAEMTIEAFGARGMRGADTDAAFVRGIDFTIEAPADDLAGTPAMRMAGGSERYTVQDMRLDKLYGYLARGEWPARTEADLLSLGLFIGRNDRIAVNGVDFYSVAESRIDARNFHWFIPTRLSLSVKDMAYNIDGLMTLSAARDPALAQDADFQAIQPQILDMLRRYGLSRPTIDYGFEWAWSAKSGESQVGLAFGLDDYMRFDLDYEGGFPKFEAVSALIPGGFETAKGEEIAKLFETSSTFKGLEVTLSDEGGLEKIFAMVAEGGKMIPTEQTGGVALFQNQTPQSLRSMTTAGLYMLADQVNAQLQGARALIAPYASFVEQGGSVKLTAAPERPLPLAATAQQLDSGALSLAGLLAQLNARTAHTPPAAKPN